jgi:cell division septum initiation protein DivIVA
MKTKHLKQAQYVQEFLDSLTHDAEIIAMSAEGDMMIKFWGDKVVAKLTIHHANLKDIYNLEISQRDAGDKGQPLDEVLKFVDGLRKDLKEAPTYE